MLIPQTFALTAYIGGTFDDQLNFWSDAAETVPFDFTRWTVSMTITVPSGGTIITPTVVVSGGSLLLSLTSTQTTGVPAETMSVLIVLTDPLTTPHTIEYLAHGTFNFVAP